MDVDYKLLVYKLAWAELDGNVARDYVAPRKPKLADDCSVTLDLQNGSTTSQC